MNEQNVFCIYSKILLPLQKKGVFDTFYDMNKHWRQCQMK